MASSFSAFFGGVATVAVALGIGFGGGLYLTDTSLMNDRVGGRTTKQEAQEPAPQPAPAAPASAMNNRPLQAAAAAPHTPEQQAAVPTTPAAAPAQPADNRVAVPPPPSPPEQATAPAVTVDANRAPTSGPSFARIPDDARARATSDDEEYAQETSIAQRRKAIAARKAEQQRRAERRRLERAERMAAEHEMRAAIAARDRARDRYYDRDVDDEPRGFFGFASGRAPDRPPTFFGIPLFGE